MKGKKIRQNTILKTILNSVQFCLYIIGIYIVILIALKIGTAIGSNNWPPTIEKIASWSQALVAYAALFAIGQYSISYIDIADKKTKNVLEYVKFFREHVISSENRIRHKIKNRKKESMPIFILRKNTPSLKFTQDEFFNKIEPNQKVLIQEYFDIIKDDLELEEMVINCLNASEEFAIGIINSNSQDHQAVTSIRRPFVQIVEEFSVPLYYHIGIKDDGFPYLSELYRHWKKDVGFVPYHKDDILDVYRERVKKYRNMRGANKSQ